MSTSDRALAVAIAWLKAEISRTDYGRLSIGVQIHAGKIAKVYRSVEEVTLAPHPLAMQVGDERH